MAYRPDEHVIETRHLAAAWAWCFAVFLLLFAECMATPHLEDAVSAAMAGRAATLEALRSAMSNQSELSRYCDNTLTTGSSKPASSFFGLPTRRSTG